jgi:hypothetical protein
MRVHPTSPRVLQETLELNGRGVPVVLEIPTGRDMSDLKRRE